MMQLPEKLPSREQIQALQDAMIPIRCDAPEPAHFFAPGMYCRKLVIPAGVCCVGKIHKHAHLMMVLKGKAIVVTDQRRDEVSAGDIFVSPAGAKRVVLTIEDTTFATVHLNKNDTHDLMEIEREHIADEGLSVEHQKAAGLLS